MTSTDFPQGTFQSQAVAPMVATKSILQGDKKESSLCEPLIPGRYLATHVERNQGGKKGVLGWLQTNPPPLLGNPPPVLPSASQQSLEATLPPLVLLPPSHPSHYEGELLRGPHTLLPAHQALCTLTGRGPCCGTRLFPVGQSLQCTKGEKRWWLQVILLHGDFF